METISKIFDEITNIRSESIVYNYLDEDHKKLDTTTTNIDDNIFMIKKIFYDDKDRVSKSEEEVFFGSGMKKKGVGKNIQTLTYDENEEAEIVKAKTEMVNNEEGITVTAVEMSSYYDKKTDTRDEEEIIYDTKSGRPAHKIITVTDPKSIIRTDYGYDKSGEEFKVSTTEVDKASNTTVITKISADKMTESIVSRTPCNIEGIDEENISERVTKNGELIQSREVQFRINKNGNLNRIENINVSQQGKLLQINDNGVFFKSDDGVWALESIKKTIDDGSKKEIIQSKNKKTDDASIVILHNSICISSLHNRSNANFLNDSDSKTMMPLGRVEYFLVAGDNTIRIKYTNGTLMSFLGRYTEKDTVYNVSFQSSVQFTDKKNQVMVSFNVEELDKSENILRKSKFNLFMGINEDQVIFDNIFNLLIKDFEEVYGKGCIKMSNQKDTILVKNTDFISLILGNLY